MARLLAVGHGGEGGFARVLRSLLGELRHVHRVEQLALGAAWEAPWPAHLSPVPGDVHGLCALPGLLARFDPDVVLVMQDPWVLPLYADALARHRARLLAYCPLDGEIAEPGLGRLVARVDRLVVYTRFARDEMAAAASRTCGGSAHAWAERIAVIPHGVDTATFRPLGGQAPPRRTAARRLAAPEAALGEDAFVVLNANRNQPRKRLATTIEAFARFAHGKPDDVRLWLHTAAQGPGCDVPALAHRHGIARRLVVPAAPGGAHPAVSDERLNAIFNACDVGLNTAGGEGWGLVSMEHAASGAAQVVPRHSACEELWEGWAELFDGGPRHVARHAPVALHAPDPASAAGALERLYADRRLLGERSAQAHARATQRQFAWGAIAASWELLIDALLRDRRRGGARVPAG